MRIVNKSTLEEVFVKKISRKISFLGIPTEMKDAGLSVFSDKDVFCKEHIVNCLDDRIVFNYITRFLEAETILEIDYIKLLARKGLLENQEVIIDGKEAKILHWNDSNKYYPMYVLKTSKRAWSKQKRILYGTNIITGYENFNNYLK